MPFPTFLGEIDYRNNGGATMDLGDCDLYVAVSYINYGDATPDSVGLRVTLGDIMALTASYEYIWDQGNPLPPPGGSWEMGISLPVQFARTHYTAIDLTQISWAKVTVGVQAHDNCWLSYCYFGTDPTPGNCAGGGGGGGGG